MNAKRNAKSKQKPKNKPKQKSSKSKSSSGSALNSITRAIGAGAAGLVGLPPSLGDSLANTASKVFKDITGFGDYQVHGNSLISSGPPIFGVNDRVTNIRHREFVRGIDSPGGAFSLLDGKGLELNPTNDKLFPWLSGVASNYQQFKFKGLIFSYESRSGNATGGNTALGAVTISTYYNPYAPPPVSRQQMDSHEFTTSTVPSLNMIHPVECDPSEQVLDHLFTRIENPKASNAPSDKRFSVMGMVYVATSGQQQVTAGLGDLWVSYDIDLLKPRLSVKSAPDVIQFTSNAGDRWFGDNQTAENNGVTPNVTIDQPAQLLIFDAGYYGDVIISYSSNSPGTAMNVGAVPAFVLTGGAATVPEFNNQLNSSIYNTTATNAMWSLSLKLTGGGVVDLSTSSLMSAPDLNFAGTLIVSYLAL